MLQKCYIYTQERCVEVIKSQRAVVCAAVCLTRGEFGGSLSHTGSLQSRLQGLHRRWTSWTEGRLFCGNLPEKKKKQS